MGVEYVVDAMADNKWGRLSLSEAAYGVVLLVVDAQPTIPGVLVGPLGLHQFLGSYCARRR